MLIQPFTVTPARTGQYQARPHWLVLVAGLRFSDIFTDWIYLYFQWRQDKPSFWFSNALSLADFFRFQDLIGCLDTLG